MGQKYGLLQSIIYRKIIDKQGGSETLWLNNLHDRYDPNTNALLRGAVDILRIDVMVTNVPKGYGI